MKRSNNTYDRKTVRKFIFLIASGAAIVFFLLVSNNIVKELAQQERERMAVWANATQRLAQADMNSDFEFLLSIISQNNTIPVMIADSAGNILEYRNFPLPEEVETEQPGLTGLSEKNRNYLKQRLARGLAGKSPAQAAEVNTHFIPVEIIDNNLQYIYYEDSILLRKLSWYPYIQLSVMIMLILIIYLTLIYSKRAEQNRVWVGLSKETAHQLGTPISSLMAWTQYLEATGTDDEVVKEIDKDVKRLSTIADRFSKIGSRPEMQLEYLNETVQRSLQYLRSRISGKVDIRMHFCDDDYGVMLSTPLFEWVMENITKNAVDAMAGAGTIDITTGKTKDYVFVEIKDTGKGIPRKDFKTIFNPGYTTKKRGWGLGLTLVKRIIADYHHGKIFVKESEIGKGTTFRIEIPLAG
ncbi:MAG: ATP-binding protein [Prevotella sp.]|nr:ATP-binding protein [Bacteroides sp.]MCM1366487.1 ATP-binding protein [Prevotella sp.]MCM1436826.1 ATP-binding protein [Prevotella sp.]